MSAREERPAAYVGDTSRVNLPRNINVEFDWTQRTNAGSWITWSAMQRHRWLWIGPFFITWEWERKGARYDY